MPCLISKFKIIWIDLKVYDLERSKECISELNMDLFHLVRNSTLQWRDEQIVSLVVNEKEEGEDYEPSS